MGAKRLLVGLLVLTEVVSTKHYGKMVLYRAVVTGEDWFTAICGPATHHSIRHRSLPIQSCLNHYCTSIRIILQECTLYLRLTSTV
ncbi:uncharacterized protein YALI1_E29115g [Yarrowia lipolytica]|uniref:Secreted protein n=1 Tax=Yarrowia lipolytica TaxID=4952 RepID=A0A1D8NJW9_YARLL|nr:hypothetical protein YALI1_E29115g [Yarrowia lipolytica]